MLDPNQLDPEQLELILMKWKMEHGTLMTSELGTEYYAIPNRSNTRRPVLRILLKILISFGFKEKHLMEKYLRGKIVDACVWDKKLEAKKARDWRSAVDGDIVHLVAQIFNEESPLPEVSPEPAPAPVVKEPVQALTKEEIERVTGLPSEPEWAADEDFIKLLEGDGKVK